MAHTYSEVLILHPDVWPSSIGWAECRNTEGK